jgi:hypothetical protein
MNSDELNSMLVSSTCLPASRHVRIDARIEAVRLGSLNSDKTHLAGASHLNLAVGTAVDNNDLWAEGVTKQHAQGNSARVRRNCGSFQSQTRSGSTGLGITFHDAVTLRKAPWA